MSDETNIGRRAVLMGLSGVIGCSKPGGMSTPASVEIPEEELTIVSAETGEPVSGAVVHIQAPGEFFTDRNGKVTVEVAEGLPLDVTFRGYPGYLARQTIFLRDQRTISLWPIKAQDDRYFPALLFSQGELWLLRRGRVPIWFSSVSDDRIVTAHRRAADRIEAACRGQIAFELPSRGAEAMISVSIDRDSDIFAANPGWGAYTLLRVSLGVITGAEIVYRTVQNAIDLAFHELAHCLGLGHVMDDGPWVTNPNKYYTAPDFNETEKRAIGFGFLRKPRWKPLDNDRDLSSLRTMAMVEEVKIIGC